MPERGGNPEATHQTAKPGGKGGEGMVEKLVSGLSGEIISDGPVKTVLGAIEGLAPGGGKGGSSK